MAKKNGNGNGNGVDKVVAVFNEVQEIIGILLSFGMVGFVIHEFHGDITTEAGVIVVAALNLPSLIVGKMWGKKEANGDNMEKMMAAMMEAKSHGNTPPSSPLSPPPADPPKDDGPPPKAHVSKPPAKVADVPESSPVGPGDKNKLVSVAKAFVDKVDETTVQGGEQIQKWAKSLGFDIPADGQTPWCAIFGGAMLLLAGFQPLRTMRARDYATYGEEGTGEVGDLWVGNSHLAIIVGKKSNGDYLICGGNQSNNVKIHPASAYGEAIAIRRAA